jgi:hypothetical protein
MRTWRGGFALVALAAIAAMIIPAAGAANPYPSGAGQFDGGAEGWQVTEASCNVPVLCTASGGYDGGDGRPAGSLVAETNIALNLVSLFESTVTLQSPDFEVGSGGVATLHLERRFVAGSLVDLAPRLDYTVQLVDRTSGKRSTSISESVAGTSGWSGEDGAAVVQAGHTYAIVITAHTSSTVVGTGLLSGSTVARFDNVALTVGAGGSGSGGAGSGGGGDSAGGGITASKLADLAPTTLAGPATLKGKRLFVKARCPKSVGRACRITVRGLLSKRKPATAQRRVKVASGKTKRLVLRVKPRAKGKLASRKRLLFKVRLRAGGAQATTLKRLRLIRR